MPATRTARSPTASHPPVTALAVGYLRRSTDRQEQSIPDQRRVIEAFAAEHDPRIVRFYTDDAISGTSTAEHPAFQQMIAAARAGADGPRFSRVIVYDVKRFGRIDNDEAGYYRHLLRPVKQSQARQESNDLAKVTIRGLVSKASSGSRALERSGGWMGHAPRVGPAGGRRNTPIGSHPSRQ